MYFLTGCLFFVICFMITIKVRRDKVGAKQWNPSSMLCQDSMQEPFDCAFSDITTRLGRYPSMFEKWFFKASPKSGFYIISQSGIVLFVLIVFTSDHHTFCRLFKVRWLAIWYINHDIMVGFCSEPFKRLSYYIHLGYGKKFSFHMGIEPRSFRLWAVCSTSRPER